jgi:hypothetical protein
MAKKKTHQRNKPTIQPVRLKSDDPIYQRCLTFVWVNRALALDDAYDRGSMAERMTEFVKMEIKDHIVKYKLF